MVVFPAASRPTIKILISFFPHSLSNNFENVRPMTAVRLDGVMERDEFGRRSGKGYQLSVVERAGELEGTN